MMRARVLMRRGDGSGRDERTLADLVEFARIEVASADIEPWAATLAAMTRPEVVGRAAALSREQALWALTLYNTTDDILSALMIADICPDVHGWRKVGRAGRERVASLAISGERRNLYGGRILHRMDSYAAAVGSQPQHAWFAEACPHPDGRDNLDYMMAWLRRITQVGRLAAFEWAEFLHKVSGFNLQTTDGCLWESSGPRESLERIYRQPASDGRWLTDRAYETKAHLAAEGVPLSWWDFETVICDFNVMRKARYYPGKHLAMISGEIAGLPDRWRPAWQTAYASVVPAQWLAVRPGVDKTLTSFYARNARIRTPLDVLETA